MQQNFSFYLFFGKIGFFFSSSGSQMIGTSTRSTKVSMRMPIAITHFYARDNDGSITVLVRNLIICKANQHTRRRVKIATENVFCIRYTLSSISRKKIFIQIPPILGRTKKSSHEHRHNIPSYQRTNPKDIDIEKSSRRRRSENYFFL